ncbi:bi-domain-containing oxidoreductase [Candidatus Margulisiibacteriota bacterium]
MLQAIVRKGKVTAEDVSAPVVSDGKILIKVVNSCISAGTEMSGVNNSKKSLFKKAIEQPEKVKKVLEKVKDEGLLSTVEQIKGKLDTSKPTGYSISGIVIGIGAGIKGFRIGDSVAAAGAGYASHAEYVNVPENLVMKTPDTLDFVEASTVTLGGIAIQGIRRADLKIGEQAVVFGAGILGLLSVQMLCAAGVRVATIDLDEARLAIAKEYGSEIIINPTRTDAIKDIGNWSGGYGADCVIFTAATSSDKPLSDAFQMCRKKGKVVLVGVSGMNINREDIYAKEIDFCISTSYGPGRYDATYEEKGLDYPYAYVRWTENRNMLEYLRLLASGAIKLDKMVNQIVPITEVEKAFDMLKAPGNKPLMVILDYGKPDKEKLKAYLDQDRKIYLNKRAVNKKTINIALVGAGGFAQAMHLPNIVKLKNKYNLYAVVDINGQVAKSIAQQFKANYATTDYQDIIKDENVDLVLITTRHDTHAGLVLAALNAGKHVFVEKPLATSKEDLVKIKAFYDNKDLKDSPVLMVGFNRRFSKYAQEIKKYTDKRINPLLLRYRMNAGYIPYDHWVHEHGGRIVGEACHIIDLMTYFTDSKIESFCCQEITPKNEGLRSDDNKSLILKYQDGSVAIIDYFSCGSKELSKEYLEVHFDQKSIVMDDYKSLKGYGIKVKEIKDNISQKGHLEELEKLYDTLTGKTDVWPIEFWDLAQTTECAADN